MIPFIQRVFNLRSSASWGSASSRAGVSRPAHDLDGQGGHVEIGVDGTPAPSQMDARDAVFLDVDPGHLGVEMEAHAELLEVAVPRVDPDVIGRTAQHPIDVDVRSDHVEEQAQADIAARAGADLPGPGRHQRPGDAVGQVPAISRRAPLGLRELPPADVLPLAVASFLAAGQQDPQAFGQKGQILGRYPEVGVDQAAQDQRHIAGRPGQMGRYDERGQVAAGHLEERRGDEVAEHSIGLVLERDSPHGVGDVGVEGGKEPETVLGRKPGQGRRAPRGDRWARRSCGPCRRADRAARRRPPRSPARPARGQW